MQLSCSEEIQAASLMTLFKMFKYIHRESRLRGHPFSPLTFIKFLLCDSHSDGFREYHGEQSILDFLGPHQSMNEPTKKLRVAVLGRKWAGWCDSATIDRMVRDIPRRRVWTETWCIKISQSGKGLAEKQQVRSIKVGLCSECWQTGKKARLALNDRRGWWVQAQLQRWAKASSHRAW